MRQRCSRRLARCSLELEAYATRIHRSLRESPAVFEETVRELRALIIGFMKGRAGTAGEWRKSPSGERYAHCRLAVAVEARSNRNRSPSPFWVSVVVVERHYAKVLANISSGEMIKATGTLTRRSEPTNDIRMRETWILRANFVMRVARQEAAGNCRDGGSVSGIVSFSGSARRTHDDHIAITSPASAISATSRRITMPTRSIAVAPHHTRRGISGRAARRFGIGLTAA